MGPTPFRRAAAAVAAALLVAACGDDGDTTPTPDAPAETTSATGAPTEHATSTTAAPAEPTTTLPGGADQLIEVTVAGNSVEGGGRHEVAVGDTVAIVVTSDVADEVHVHGYDVYADIGPGAPTTVVVEAAIPGVWEVELHDSGSLLLELAVS